MKLSVFQILTFLIGFCGSAVAVAAPGSISALERSILEYVAEVSRPLMGPDQISASIRIEVEADKKIHASNGRAKKVIEIRLGSLDVTADYIIPEKRKVASVLPPKARKTFMEKVKTIHLLLTIAPEVDAETVKVLKKAIQSGWPWEKHPVAMEIMHHPFMEPQETEPAKDGSGSVVVKPINRIQVRTPAPAPIQDGNPWILLSIGVLIAASILFSGFQIGKINFRAEVVLPAGFHVVSSGGAQAPAESFSAARTAEANRNYEETTAVQDVSRLESEQFEVIDLETTRIQNPSSHQKEENWADLPHEVLKLAFQEMDAEEKKVLIWTRPAGEWTLWIDRLTDADSKLREQLKLEMEILRQSPGKTAEWLSRKSKVEARFVECCLKVANHRPDLKWSGLGGKNAKVS